MKNVEIEVCERMGDWFYNPVCKDGKFLRMKEMPKFHAQIKGKPGIWSCGKNADEAIGDLIRSHPEQFGVKITMVGRQPR